jgi:anaerobic magnesium-protoporphyrin IX monomethyl ester cyclase
MNSVVLFNPRSANSKPRIPNSILHIAAALEGNRDYVMVDGNLETDPSEKIFRYISTGRFKYFGVTAMPGPQLQQAIPISKKIRELHPDIVIIWGGYFATNQAKVVLNSGYVDFVMNGPGEKSFPALLHALENNQPYELISNLIYKSGDEIVRSRKDELYDQDALQSLPYDKLNTFYPIRHYLGKTYLGTRTIAYHSSVGCPFKCSFCATMQDGEENRRNSFTGTLNT